MTQATYKVRALIEVELEVSAKAGDDDDIDEKSVKAIEDLVPLRGRLPHFEVDILEVAPC